MPRFRVANFPNNFKLLSSQYLRLHQRLDSRAIPLAMGRELQKKKNRSSTAKVRHKPKSKKKILDNPIIAANWSVFNSS